MGRSRQVDNLKERALAYHSEGKPGKLEVIPSKPCRTADELSLAYTPGVAQPVLEIEKILRMPTSTPPRVIS